MARFSNWFSGSLNYFFGGGESPWILTLRSLNVYYNEIYKRISYMTLDFESDERYGATCPGPTMAYKI